MALPVEVWRMILGHVLDQGDHASLHGYTSVIDSAFGLNEAVNAVGGWGALEIDRARQVYASTHYPNSEQMLKSARLISAQGYVAEAQAMLNQDAAAGGEQAHNLEINLNLGIQQLEQAEAALNGGPNHPILQPGQANWITFPPAPPGGALAHILSSGCTQCFDTLFRSGTITPGGYDHTGQSYFQLARGNQQLMTYMINSATKVELWNCIEVRFTDPEAHIPNLPAFLSDSPPLMNAWLDRLHPLVFPWPHIFVAGQLPPSPLTYLPGTVWRMGFLASQGVQRAMRYLSEVQYLKAYEVCLGIGGMRPNAFDPNTAWSHLFSRQIDREVEGIIRHLANHSSSVQFPCFYTNLISRNGFPQYTSYSITPWFWAVWHDRPDIAAMLSAATHPNLDEEYGTEKNLLTTATAANPGVQYARQELIGYAAVQHFSDNSTQMIRQWLERARPGLSQGAFEHDLLRMIDAIIEQYERETDRAHQEYLAEMAAHTGPLPDGVANLTQRWNELARIGAEMAQAILNDSIRRDVSVVRELNGHPRTIAKTLLDTPEYNHWLRGIQARQRSRLLANRKLKPILNAIIGTTTRVTRHGRR